MTWTRRWRRYWRGEWRRDWRGKTYDASFPGTTTGGVATFALELDAGYKVKFDWPGAVASSRSGLENRASRNTRAKESYSGQAWLLGDAPVDVRTTLAKYAATGASFLLALPHEELLLIDDAVGMTVYVEGAELALTDWATPGQRVVVYREDDEDNLESIDAVIQDVGANTITLDVAPGAVGRWNGRIAPAKAIYFEPEQNFGRFEAGVEQWSINALAIDFDFARPLASLEIGPITACAGLEEATVTERVPGTFPTLAFDALAGLAVPCKLLESVSGNFVIVQYKPGLCTPADVFAKLSLSSLIAPTGTWGAGVLDNTDAFLSTQLTGGDYEGDVGRGATLTEHDGKPVWDWPVRLAGQATDSIHALTEIVDMGGKPYVKGLADQADWGRAVAMRSADRYDWQWFKLFMTTVRGCQKSWWMPSWRNDLTFVSKAANTITVSGDVAAWYPQQRQDLQVWETDDTVTRARITDAVKNGDGTWTLTIGTTLASSSVRMVSWLELCRFERPDFTVTFGERGFEFATVARGVQA